MSLLRAVASGLLLATVFVMPAHAETAGGAKPSSKTASAKPKHDVKKVHADKKKTDKRVSAAKKDLKGDKDKLGKDHARGHHVAAKGDHADVKKDKKQLGKDKAKSKHDSADKRPASRDKAKDHKGSH